MVVTRAKDAPDRYLILDGHIRYTVLVDAGTTEIRCLVAMDDEAYTYNKRINRLATIQEHYMIVRAIERGVSEEKLANALNMDVKSIRRRRGLLMNMLIAEARRSSLDGLTDRTLGAHRNPHVLNRSSPTQQRSVHVRRLP